MSNEVLKAALAATFAAKDIPPALWLSVRAVLVNADRHIGTQAQKDFASRNSLALGSAAEYWDPLAFPEIVEGR